MKLNVWYWTKLHAIFARVQHLVLSLIIFFQLHSPCPLDNGNIFLCFPTLCSIVTAFPHMVAFFPCTQIVLIHLSTFIYIYLYPVLDIMNIVYYCQCSVTRCTCDLYCTCINRGVVIDKHESFDQPVPYIYLYLISFLFTSVCVCT